MYIYIYTPLPGLSLGMFGPHMSDANAAITLQRQGEVPEEIEEEAPDVSEKEKQDKIADDKRKDLDDP